MKKYSLLLALAVLFTLFGCGNKNYLGEKVKEPFAKNKYESDRRYWRAVGKGGSKDDNIAKNKADLQAKKELAQQVATRLKVVSDQYLSDTETINSEEINDKFQSLVREVTNTQIADLRKIGQEKYTDGEVYTVFVAYEIHKKKMLRFLKKKAKVDAKMDKVMRQTIENIIDDEMAKLED